MEKNNKTLNVPHLRFPEFSGEWESTPISTIADIIGGGTPDTSVDEYWGGNIQWFTPSEIGKEKYAYLSDRTITEAGLKNSSAKLLPQGTVLLSTRATIGECSIATAECTTNQGFQSLVAKKNNVSSEFLYYIVAKIKREMLRRSCGSTFLEISANELKKIHANIPSKAEQEKLVSLLSLIDQRIETQKKIIEKYESLIRGLCEKLTRQGTPNKIIAECLKCHSTSLQESAVLDAGSYPVYGAIGICGYTDTPDVSGDGILIIKDGASVGVTYFADGTYSFIGTLNRLTANEDINLRYVYYCLKVLNFTPYKTGLAIPHIYFKDYGKHKIWCPTLEQQSKIADALTTIENKIQVEKSLLAHLNSQKQYMLNQLFI